jgi:hypothetical protein
VVDAPSCLELDAVRRRDGSPAGANVAPAVSGRTRPGAAWILALALVATALYAPNWNDYFVGDDFDLIGSFYGKPPSYLVALLWSNESGDVWKTWGIDPELGRGYLRPLKIWLLKLDSVLWGTNALGFRLTSTAFFVALVLLAFGILREFLPGRPLLAFAGGCAVALHPVFAEVVPFITAREEVVTAVFSLGALLAFLRARAASRPLVAFHVLYALALLTKEWAIAVLALPLAWDLLHGRLVPRSLPEARRVARDWLPAAVILAVYFGLRFVAFGNLKGGDGRPTAFLSPEAFMGYHARFFEALFDPTMLSIGGLPGVAPAVALAALALLVLVLFRRRTLPEGRLRVLVFLGPLWYFATTAIFHGIYFTGRHQVMAVIGLMLFLVALVDSLFVRESPRREAWAAASVLIVALTLFFPPVLATSAEFRQASRAVAEIRATIEERTAHLPPGSAVSVEGVPQWMFPPFYFGWGLLSALKRPFTATDLARHSTVINQRNLALTGAQPPPSSRFDLVIEFLPRDWVSPELRERQMLRVRREGYAPRTREDAPL